MTKKKTYVKVKSSKPTKCTLKQQSWKDIKVEQTGDPKKKARYKRFFAVLCLLIAITFKVIVILGENGNINWYSSIHFCGNMGGYVPLGCSTASVFLRLDVAFALIGFFLWNQANHIDLASEKDKEKSWLCNNLGIILSVVAFLPLIVLAFLNKNSDKKSKV